MPNPLDTITCTDVVTARCGERLEVLSSSGATRGQVKVVGQPSATMITVRSLVWYERAWYWVVDTTRAVVQRLRHAFSF